MVIDLCICVCVLGAWNRERGIDNFNEWSWGGVLGDFGQRVGDYCAWGDCRSLKLSTCEIGGEVLELLYK